MKCLFRILDKLLSKFAAVLLLIGALTLNAFPQNIGKAPHTVTLKQGQVVQMKLGKRLSSGRAQVGDDVLLRLSAPILAEGVTVLPKGSAIQGRISAVKRAGKNCQFGSIRWGADPLAAPDGTKIEMRIAEQGEDTWRLARAARDEAEARASEKTPPKATGMATHKKGSSVGGVLKGIAIAPAIAVALPLTVASEGHGACPNGPSGKGREESFWKGKPFYAEVTEDVQISVQ